MIPDKIIKMNLKDKKYFKKVKNFNFIQNQKDFSNSVDELTQNLKEILVDIFDFKQYSKLPLNIVAHNILCSYRYLEAIYASSSKGIENIDVEKTCFYDSFLGNCLRFDVFLTEIGDSKKIRLFNKIHQTIYMLSKKYSFLEPIKYEKFEFDYSDDEFYEFLFEIGFWDRNKPEEYWAWDYFEWNIEARLFLYSSYYLSELYEIDELNKTIWDLWAMPIGSNIYIDDHSVCVYVNLKKWKAFAEKFKKNNNDTLLSPHN